MRRFIVLIVCFIVFTVGCWNPALEESLREDNLLNTLASEYFAEYVRSYPVEATLRGHHDFDGELGNLTRDAIQGRLAWVQDFRQRLLGVHIARVSQPAYIDLMLLTRAVKAEIHNLSALEEWRRSPFYYSERIRIGIQSLLRNESPSDTRVQSLISRLEQIPSIVEVARGNVENPPRLLVEEAISGLQLSVMRIEALPEILGRSSTPRKDSELSRVNRESVLALQRYITHLESVVLPQASVTFALGTDGLSRELLYEEMESVELDTLRGISEREMRRLRAEMDEIVARLGTSGSPDTVLDALASEHPASVELLRSTEEILQEIQQFIRERLMFESIPQGPVSVVQTPQILRGQRFLFLNPSGCLEHGDEASYFMLTPPPLDGSPQQTESHLENFNTRALRLAGIREIHPGRFLYHSYQKDSTSRIRRLLISSASADGWSHYVEQMFLDEGYNWDDPLLRLTQLRRALIEQCRLTTAIGLHSEQMSIEQAAQAFRELAFLDPEEAMREARWIACDWTRASAALGKLQILKLREDYLGDEPSRTLRSFHEELLAGAGLPLKLIRLMILPEDQRPTLGY